MESKDYLKDLSEIKDIMHKSTRFMSLSGLSGILAGIFSLIGAWRVHDIIYATETPSKDAYKSIVIYELEMLQIVAIAIIVIILSMLAGIYFSWRKARKHNEKLWDAASKRLLINFLIPLVTGGFFILFLIEKEIYAFVAPLTLVFYGLACVNASKYTLGYTRYLGITMIIIGLLSVYYLGYGLYFWAFGFGVCHIVYGLLMYFKFDKS
ncbi:MAG: hypothetical protein KJO41_11505 [Bacteroidia bacterium]|nr:hypothetical protein [Bacteroidia bacterium]NND25323.1 hypothetical protein [Flavobacteriaceae bacterium]MBT8279623.1 hypothetical protein [Bacteroidia bacterium]NNK59277.1 hypothetical protein [Flavobacteriaceae bacterium]NNL32261.1 hypothetical protein [Flavobacteriaceae bacterium]